MTTKFKSLYIAINHMMIRLGAEGEITTRADEVSDVMDALKELDDGLFDVDAVFKKEDNNLRAKWFEKGQLSVKRKNESGCVCIINDADEVVSVCLAHKAWMEEQCQS